MNTDVSRPEMILFDYGDTLVWEPVPDFPRGWRAVFQYVTENPDGVTPEQAHQLADGLWRRFSASRSLSASRKGGWEIHEWQQLRTVLEALGLRASLPLSELECVLMDHACQSHLFPHVEETLDSLRGLGIRTGVISNIGWSGQALARRLDKLLPGHSFEFVIASSEYGIRKPDPLIFQIALKKARLPAAKVWFCGDSWEADILGAFKARLFPVWVQSSGGAPPGGGDFPYLKITGWQELVSMIDRQNFS